MKIIKCISCTWCGFEDDALEPTKEQLVCPLCNSQMIETVGYITENTDQLTSNENLQLN